MLLQNPQLAYALLQAQVVMKIVDPNIAQVFNSNYCLTLNNHFKVLQTPFQHLLFEKH